MFALLVRSRAELRLPAAGRALAAMAVPCAYYSVSADALVLKLTMITVSLMIVMERIAFALPLLLIHVCLIMFSITTFYVTAAEPCLFIGACALLAFASANVMHMGERWKAIGTFTLVPGLYIGSALHAENRSVTHLWQQLSLLLPMVVTPPVLVLFCWHACLQWRSGLAVTSLCRRLTRSLCAACRSMWRRDLFWPPSGTTRDAHDLARRMSAARALGATLASLWVMTRNSDFGEWVIWSTASVVAGDWPNCRLRWFDRMFGLLLGLPFGMVIAHFLPGSQFASAVGTLGVYVSLIMFTTYRYAYILRCALMAIAAGNSLLLYKMTAWRIENVVVGCAIGIAAAFMAHYGFSTAGNGGKERDK